MAGSLERFEVSKSRNPSKSFKVNSPTTSNPLQKVSFGILDLFSMTNDFKNSALNDITVIFP